MRSSSGHTRRRRILILAASVALVGWIAVDLAAGRGLWIGAGRYFSGLLGRAGPTRDLLSGFRRAAGQRDQRPVKLRVWDWWSPSTTEDYARYFDELERIFEARHPDVEVIFQAVPFGNYEQKITTAMLGSDPPDVFQCSVNWAQGLHDRGMLRELNDFIARTPELREDQFMPSAWYHNQRQGRVFGVPHIVDAACLIWNLDMIRAEPKLHGMFETGPDGKPDFRRIRFKAVSDWDDFRRIAKLLTKPGPSAASTRPAGGEAKQAGFALTAYGMGARLFMPWAATNGVRFQNRAGTEALFDTPATAETLDFLLKLYWEDRVCPPFRRELTAHGQFQEGKVACAMAGTWSGKYIVRNTQGWMGFGMTAFPPGPRGGGYKTLTWANMMVMSSRSRVPEAAWEYIRLVCGPEGALLRLKHLQQNSPRLDFNIGDAWAAAVRDRPYLANVPRICASGDPLHHTQVQAVQDEVQWILEYMLLNWPKVQAGTGKFGDSAEAISLAARRVNLVYGRYSRMLRAWNRRQDRPPEKKGR